MFNRKKLKVANNRIYELEQLTLSDANYMEGLKKEVSDLYQYINELCDIRHKQESAIDTMRNRLNSVDMLENKIILLEREFEIAKSQQLVNRDPQTGRFKSKKAK